MRRHARESRPLFHWGRSMSFVRSIFFPLFEHMRQPSNVTLLYAARAARGFGDGFAVIILPAYLAELGFTPLRIGIVATSALLGTALLTLAVGHFASRFDLRGLLLAGALSMAATGVAFSGVEYFPFVIIIAFLGTTNPSSGDIGIFVPLEHAMLAKDASDDGRTRIFARYSLIGGLSSSAGALAATTPDLLVALGAGKIGALQAMFGVYAGLGLLAAGLYRLLPRAPSREGERQPVAVLGPSRAIVYRLAALFSLDAFAGGFAVQS